MSDEPRKNSDAKAKEEDVNSPDAIIKAMYDVISGPAGPKNWYRERSLFLDEARLIPIGKRVHKEDGGLHVMTVDEWIEDAQKFLEENDFYESEIMRKSHQYGDIMQVFSTYEAKNDPSGPAITRGVNSIELLKKDGRWWIVSIMWDNETKENPIPEEFLPYLW